MRALAEKMGDCNAATLLDDLANDYDKLAARAEGRSGAPCPNSEPFVLIAGSVQF
jgi:hypothetical protein